MEILFPQELETYHFVENIAAKIRFLETIFEYYREKFGKKTFNSQNEPTGIILSFQSLRYRLCHTQPTLTIVSISFRNLVYRKGINKCSE